MSKFCLSMALYKKSSALRECVLFNLGLYPLQIDLCWHLSSVAGDTFTGDHSPATRYTSLVREHPRYWSSHILPTGQPIPSYIDCKNTDGERRNFAYCNRWFFWRSATLSQTPIGKFYSDDVTHAFPKQFDKMWFRRSINELDKYNNVWRLSVKLFGHFHSRVWWVHSCHLCTCNAVGFNV